MSVHDLLKRVSYVRIVSGAPLKTAGQRIFSSDLFCIHPSFLRNEKKGERLSGEQAIKLKELQGAVLSALMIEVPINNRRLREVLGDPGCHFA